MKNPWSKFYWADWRSDPRLRMCCLAARGLWMEMLALMHEAEPYGHLVVSGNAPTDVELGVLAGAPPSQIPELLGELERVGVFSRTRKGTIYSRRMLRDEKKAATAVKNGKGGGNPKLCNETPFLASDNPPLNRKDKPQKLEARNQKEEREGSEVKETSGAEAPSLEAEVFRRGKLVLGTKAGGQITKLRKALGFDDVAVLTVLNEARAKENPAEWLAGFLKRRNGEAETDEFGLPIAEPYDAGEDYRRMGVEGFR